MPNPELIVLGQRISELRIARRLTQVELAYEAGVSHRTLQRLEAGEPVKSDGLVKIIKCLGQLDSILDALESTAFSPYEKLAEAGLKVSRLKPQRPAAMPAAERQPGRVLKRRVRRTRAEAAQPDAAAAAGDNSVVKVQWPEDQR